MYAPTFFLYFYFNIRKHFFTRNHKFCAEFSSLLSATKYSIFVGVSVCIGIFLETVYSFFMYNKIYFGSFSNFTYQTRDLTALQYQSFTPLLALILLLGVMPNFIVPFLLTALAFQVSL